MVKLVNRAKMTTATTGTGTITLGSAVDGFQTFDAAGVVDTDVVRYVIEDGTAWEIGTGTYSSSGGTLTRTPSESSVGGGAITLSGDATVFATAAGEDILQPTDIASKAEAEAGTDNSKLMTPLRTAQAIAELAGGGVGIGQPFPVWDHIPGAEVPDNSGTSKFIRLTAGQSGSGGYNEGLLTDETVSGSAPLVESDAEIMVGPMAGQRVPLINTEMSFIRPGTSSGTLQFDEFKSHSHGANYFRSGGDGSFVVQTSGGSLHRTGGSDNAGGDETRPKNRQATFYMRIV